MKENFKLSKVLIPIAGLGTRMLPATKAIPKEMLPIVDKPIIQLIVEEAAMAGFKEIIFITHSSKYSVENHFDTSFELEATLEKRVKRSLLKEIRSISNLRLNISSVRQGEAKGLGHAILSAKSNIGKEPFAIMLPDMLIDGSNKLNNFALMKKRYDKNFASSILLDKARKGDLNKFGIAKVKKERNKSFFSVLEIIEKPSIKKAPSNLYAVGRYIFDNKLINFLEVTKPDKSGEIQLTDAISEYLKEENKVEGIVLEGKVFDCGERMGLLKANLEFAMKDSYLRKSLLNYLKKF